MLLQGLGEQCVEDLLERQRADVERLRRQEHTPIPADLDLGGLTGLRREASEKLVSLRPETLGAAARIAGTGATRPVHCWSCATPCATSIDAPCATGQPAALACTNNAVDAGLYAASSTAGLFLRHAGGSSKFAAPGIVDTTASTVTEAKSATAFPPKALASSSALLVSRA